LLPLAVVDRGNVSDGLTDSCSRGAAPAWGCRAARAVYPRSTCQNPVAESVLQHRRRRCDAENRAKVDGELFARWSNGQRI